ncbi:MAG: caspase family protein, partial [Pseudomonadota bacterium]
MARSFFAILLSLAIAASASAQNTKRAFIVGVGDYDELTDLQKTVGDAEGYAAVFQNDLGFETVSLIDPDTDAFYDAFDAFIDSIQPGDDVAFIFSGHGWSNGAENYLAFSDAPYEATERSLERKTVSLPVDVLEVIKERNPNLVLAVIDA